MQPKEFWSAQKVELLTRTSVTALDLDSHIAKLSDKQEIHFEKALIATGANVRRLNVPGCELEQIHYLRTLGNSDTIRAGVADAERVVLDRGLLHRLRGRSLVDDDGQAGNDRDAGGRDAGARLRQDGRALLPGPARIARRHDARCRRAGALRGRWPRGQGRHDERLGARGRRGRDRRGSHPGHCAGQARRPRDRRAGWSAVLLAPRDIGAGRVRRRRHRRVRLAAARHPRAHRALGRRVQPRQDRRRSTCSAAMSRTRWCPTSTRCSATGANSSTSAPHTSGTRRSCAAPTRRPSSPPGICRTVACARRVHASAAPGDLEHPVLDGQRRAWSSSDPRAPA